MSEGQRGEPLHIVAAGEAEGVPLLVARAPGAGPVEVRLAGDFDWRLSGTRTCVGRWNQGVHVPCPGGVAVVNDAVCLACSGLADPECVFEPRCANGDACHCPFGPTPHVVYVAMYGPLAKVGLTQAWRLPLRAREQGADAYFAIATCSDRGAARRLERQVSFLHGIPEFRSPREILPQMVRDVAWDVVASRAERLRDVMAERHGQPGPVVRVTDHPVELPLPSVPRRVAPHGRHVGTWLGAKGQNVFYLERRPNALGGLPVAALKLRDLLGRSVTPDDDA